MKKLIIVVAAVGLFALLVACGPTTPPPTAEPTNTPTSIPEEATEAAPESAAAFPTPNPNPECVAEPIPEDPNVPPPTADDWSKGSDDAPVTLIEYGDFQ
jgi:hypothetical protein